MITSTLTITLNKHLMHRLLILLLTTFVYSLTAQNSTARWERFYGGIMRDDLRTVIENGAGDLVAVGMTKSKLFRGEDVLLRVLDERGAVKIKQNFGGKKNDGANAMIPAFDGGYLLAGYTNSKWEESHGKQDAWLVKTDEFGEPLWHRCLGGKKNDVFNTLLQLDDGSIVAAGQQDDDIYVVRVSADGATILWEKVIRRTATTVTALTLNDRQHIALTGTTGKKQKERAFFMRLNQAGEVIQRLKTINDKSVRGGVGIVYDYNERDYTIAGQHLSRERRQDACLIKVDESGKVKSIQHYGGFANDVAQALIQTIAGELYLVGHTRSHLRGARRSRGWLQRVDLTDEKKVQAANYYGGVHADDLLAVTELHDGDLLLAGSSASNPGLDRDAWLLKVSRPQPTTTVADAELSDLTWHEETINNILDAEERAYFSFSISNSEAIPLTGWYAEVATTRPIVGMRFSEKVIFPAVPSNGKRKVSIPVRGETELEDGQTIVKLLIKNAAGQTVRSFDWGLITKSQPLPQLAFVNSRFVTENELPERNEMIQLEVQIANVGNDTAQAAGVRFFHHRRIVAKNDEYQDVGNLPPGDTATVTFEFKARSYYEFDSIAIRVAAIEATAKRGAYDNFGLRIKNFYDLEDDPEFIRRPGNDYFKNSNIGNRGPLTDFNYIANSGVQMTWTAPNEFGDEGLIRNVEIDYIVIKLTVLCEEELSEDDFDIYINNVVAVDGQNIDKSSEGIWFKSLFRDEAPPYQIACKVLLEEGENNIFLRVKSRSGFVDSRVMTINYTPPKSNLHIYAFGIPHDNLQFTTKDAKVFAQSFHAQEDRLFKSVNTHSFVSSDSTTKQSVSEAMDAIYNSYYVSHEIQTDDVLMFFVSSHGLVLPQLPDKFRVACSNYDPMKLRSTSLDFSVDVLETLSLLPDVKKFIFIDACYSGFAANEDNGVKNNDDLLMDKAISKAVVELAESTQEFSTIVSCRADERSYEDVNWGNGAFTRGLLDAFNNVPISVKGSSNQIIADKNEDGILHMKELYNFLKIRVPNLVSEKRPKVKQNPYIPEAHLKDNSPIYVINK